MESAKTSASTNSTFQMEEFSIEKFNPDENLCIVASAGTGKTYTIQSIVCEMLRRKNRDGKMNALSDILIVTYTEKAAEELRDRIRSKIQRVIDENDFVESGKYASVSEQKENFILQMEEISSSPIFTIHSFCQRTLEEFYFSAEKPRKLSLVDDSEISSLLDEWIRDELPADCENGELFSLALSVISASVVDSIKTKLSAAVKKFYLDGNGKEVPKIITLDKDSGENQQLFLDFSLEDFKNIFAAAVPENLCAFLSVWNKISGIEEKISGNETEIFFDKLSELKKYAESGGGDFNKNDIEKFKKLYDSIDSYLKSGRFLDFFDGRIKTAKANSESFSEIFSYFSELKAKLAVISAFRESAKSFLVSKICTDNLQKIYSEWISLKTSQKMQSYDDMIRSVREAVVKKDSLLLLNLQKKYRYGIIDEFQDTNRRQWDIFRRIFLSEGHSIVVVGDPKQSIYSFQGADVKVFGDAVNEISSSANGKIMCLSTNYRSTKPMIEACNRLFEKKGGNFAEENNFFAGQNIGFEGSSSPKIQPEKLPAEYFDCESGKWRGTEPFLIMKGEDEFEKKKSLEKRTEFAKFAVSFISDACSFVSDSEQEKTKLQVFKKYTDTDGKEKTRLKNVSFSDFTVLARTKTEMAEIKQELSRAGIPYSHYKESNLFLGTECAHWISVFNAIAAEDFSGMNNRILKEALLTKFFDVSLSEIDDKKFNEADNEERNIIIGWHKCAQGRQWSLLMEKIYSESKIEERLSKLDKMQSLAKYRQIGDYAAEYLYKKNCSVSDLSRHLSRLSACSSGDDEDSNIVAIGTDFDCVKIMTIHASKGLQFPVVIAPCGISERKTNNDVYSYHVEQDADSDENQHSLPVLSFFGSEKSKKLSSNELSEETHRLFYVAYTRAESLLVLPPAVTEDFINANIRFMKENCSSLIREVEFDSKSYSVKNVKENVQKIIEGLRNKNNSEQDENPISNETEENQRKILSKVASSVPSLKTRKFSYSSLSHGKLPPAIEGDRAKRVEIPEGDGDLSKFDENFRKIEVEYDQSRTTKISEKYPKGSSLGEAVHQVFESADFFGIGKMKGEEDALNDSRLCSLINRKFGEQGFLIDKDDTNCWRRQTASIVYNTMKAKFPCIKGNSALKNGDGTQFFTLGELKDAQRTAEAEFNMTSGGSSFPFGEYFNGFVDLMFVRNVDGEDVYSVLDWKSDIMDDELDFCDGEKLSAHVAEKYSIQRVLYSYCLIKWLSGFKKYKSMSDSEIFDRHFGGIYYVLVRGCCEGTSNGIYAQTWDSWETLESAFGKIMNEKVRKL